jgi:hypothetical protein
MQLEVYQDKPLEYLDDILIQDGEMQVLPAADLAQIDNTALRLWCHKKGIYGIPSKELIALIKSHLVPDQSIEVGAGCGVFGRALQIPSTDSMIQNTPEIKAFYTALRQPTVEYGKHVINLEASAAIDQFRPDVVFGSWVTQYVPPEQAEELCGQGAEYGLKETEFMSKLKKYIVYGNDVVHGHKKVLNMPEYKVERVYNVSDFFSRASKPVLNCLYIITHA